MKELKEKKKKIIRYKIYINDKFIIINHIYYHFKYLYSVSIR